MITMCFLLYTSYGWLLCKTESILKFIFCFMAIVSLSNLAEQWDFSDKLTVNKFSLGKNHFHKHFYEILKCVFIFKHKSYKFANEIWNNFITCHRLKPHYHGTHSFSIFWFIFSWGKIFTFFTMLRYGQYLSQNVEHILLLH